MGPTHEFIDHLVTEGPHLVNVYKRLPRVSQASPDFRDRTPERAKVTLQPRRQSTTISMLEEELGMCEPPQAVTRFGLPSRLRIIPPKRKQSLTQAPKPCRKSSFLKGPWEIVWDCDMDEAYRTESLPEEDVNLLSDEVLGHGEQNCGLDRSVTLLHWYW
ncbi:hypothetical protein BGW80DRAFT_521040 [Lactifluus volemus]|nr:hypothetical protein BGW80DRAFT_521040 [Lactifluus volemus]